MYMKDNSQNVFGYIDDLNNSELNQLQKQLVSDIEYLKQINDKKNLDFEVERLRHVVKVLKERKQNQEQIKSL